VRVPVQRLAGVVGRKPAQLSGHDRVAVVVYWYEP